MEDYTKTLKSASSSQTLGDEDAPDPKDLPLVPAGVYESLDEEERMAQLKRDEALARELEGVEQWELEKLESAKQRELEVVKYRELVAAKERELEAEKQQRELEAAKEREQEAAQEKVRLIVQIMKEQEKAEQQKNVTDQRHRREPKAKQKEVSTDESEEESSDDDESSEDDVVRWAMKEATAKRKAREANRNARDQASLHAHMNALNIRPPYYGGPVPGMGPGMGPGIWTNERSGNVTTSIRTNVGNDNSTYIKKGMSPYLCLWRVAHSAF